MGYWVVRTRGEVCYLQLPCYYSRLCPHLSPPLQPTLCQNPGVTHNLLWFFDRRVHAATVGATWPLVGTVPTRTGVAGWHHQWPVSLSGQATRGKARLTSAFFCFCARVCWWFAIYCCTFSHDITSEFTRFCVSKTNAYLVVKYRAYLQLVWCHSFDDYCSLGKFDCARVHLSQGP